MTNAHGEDVTKILSATAASPTYNFYQIVDQYGEYDDSELIKAIVYAADHGTDVLNISLGSDHLSNPEKDCDEYGSNCAVCEAAEYAIDDGVVVVAATGNKPRAEAVCCPALGDRVISVGSCVVACEAVPSSDQESHSTTAHDYRAPGSYWIERADNQGTDEVFCGGFGCSPDESCADNQSMETWSGNVRFVNGTPDTLAPGFLPRAANNGAYMGAGTSFATPLVSAAIVNILVAMEGESVRPDTLRELLRVTGKPVDNVPVGMMDAHELVNELREEFDLEPIRTRMEQEGTNLGPDFRAE